MVNKLTIGQVIYINFPHTSFKWANGLKVIARINGTSIDFIDLDNQGELSLLNDGKYMLTTTSINNAGIKVIEGLTYKINKKLL
jgi:hypothetical protein